MGPDTVKFIRLEEEGDLDGEVCGVTIETRAGTLLANGPGVGGGVARSALAMIFSNPLRRADAWKASLPPRAVSGAC